ncbi:hypothetical protein ACFLZ1_00450 [Patescibacteria group bacterium]
MTERDTGPSKKEKSLQELIDGVFAELMKRIAELVKLKKENNISKKQAGNLQELKKEEKRRRQAFLQTEFGQNTEKKQQTLASVVDQAKKDLETASEDALAEQIKQKEERLKKDRQKAQQFWQQDKDELDDPLLHGIAEYDLSGELKKAEEQLEEAKKKQKPKTEPVADKKPALKTDRLKEQQQALELLKREDPDNKEKHDEMQEKLSKGEEVPELQRIVDRYKGLQDGRGITKEDQERLKVDAKFREKTFEELLNKFGTDPGRQFRDADIYTISDLSRFNQALVEKPDILRGYQLRFGFEEQVHNLNFWLSGQAHISKAPDVTTQFQSNMLDEALRVPGAVAAFRAYEQAFSKLAMEHGYLPAEKLTRDPDTKQTWVDNWVKEQVRESLIGQLQEKLGNREKAEQEYSESFNETSFLRTGYKIFIFSLRGDEIQAELEKVRDFPNTVGAPWHEDLHRRLDPLSMPLRYWSGKMDVDAFLGNKEKEQLTKLYYFFTGDMEKKFPKYKDWQKAMHELEEKGENQFNIFNIGGILSVSDWRAGNSMAHVPEFLAPFMGIEMSRKKWQHGELMKEKGYKKPAIASKRNALAYGLIRNPMRIFQLADEKERDKILKQARLKKEDLGDVYDDLAKALQMLVMRQQEGMNEILETTQRDSDERDNKAKDFFKKHKKDGLSFDFITDAKKRKRAEDLVGAIQGHFGLEELEKRMDKDSILLAKSVRGNDAFEGLVDKKVAFSLGTDDAPMEFFRFVELGDVALQRRFRDLGAAARATEGFWKLTNNLGQILQKEDDMIGVLKEIHGALDEYHSFESHKYMLTLTDRIIEMVDEDRVQKLLPWPACQLRDRWFLTSKAEKFFGQHHMSEDKEESRLLIEKLISSGIFQGMKATDVRKHLYKKFKLGAGHVYLEKSWRYGPAVIVGLLIAAGLIVANEVRKGFEETAKEA